MNNTIEKVEILVPKILSYDIMDSFQCNVLDLISHNPPRLEINCSEIEHVTSSHVNLIWRAHSACTTSGVKACLSNPSHVLINVLKVLDLSDEILNCNGSHLLASSIPKGIEFDNDQFQLRIPLSSEGSIQALKKFRQFLGQVSLPKNCTIELETVFYETITNVRMHSGLSPERELEFTAITSNNMIEMTFKDFGVEYDPSKVNTDFDPASAIKERCRHGLGLIMISRMSGKLSYHRSEDGQNVFVIERSWG